MPMSMDPHSPPAPGPSPTMPQRAGASGLRHPGLAGCGGVSALEKLRLAHDASVDVPDGTRDAIKAAGAAQFPARAVIARQGVNSSR
jgi:hypothetical protein